MVDRIKNRFIVQLGFSAITNGYIKGYLNGIIYTGKSKYLCVPGLSCYSCPGALGSCPLGSLQSMLASRDIGFTFYVTGFLFAIGAIFGRFVCGWLCPFGLFQDLLYKIPFIKKVKVVKADSLLKLIKYLILIIFVIIFPLFVLDLIGQGQTGFCKWICPAGTLMAGWPLAIVSEGIRNALGYLFAWKSIVLILIIILSIIIYRPFCRYICPLGAIYGLFNPFAFYRYTIDNSKCTGCQSCAKICRLGISVYDTPNSMECIRCGDCINACPSQAIKRGLRDKRIGCIIDGQE
ncbi:MAG: 4Fe-4S binding protein [Clostridiales bacterium]|mgnify:CR=1 FL=1|nr:4Fe-4S binding protein [Clostridiales bacterium]